MFSIPVTIPFRKPEGIMFLDVVVAIDDIVLVEEILDKRCPFDVESVSSELLPSAELLLHDGRKLPVLETTAIIHEYLDAYRAIEDFYTNPDAGRAVVARQEGVVVDLFKDRPRPCASSEESTPD